MGPDDEAVTDGEGRVKGADGLRVVYAWIMPKNVTGILNGPIVTMAEKISRPISGRAPLPPSQASHYRAGGT